MTTLKSFVMGLFLLLGTGAAAQVSVNVNIGPPPVWGPPVTIQEYYYLPDIESYYDLRTSQFIYLHRGNWIRSASLPVRYRGYDLHRGNVIVLDYHGAAPYKYYKNHKVKYVKKWHPGKPKGHGKHKNKHRD